MGVANGLGIGLAVGVGVGLAGKPGVGVGVGVMLDPGPEPVVTVRLGETQPRMKTIRAENRRGWIQHRQRTFPPRRQKYLLKPGRRSNPSCETQVLGRLWLCLNQTLASSLSGVWVGGMREGRVVLSFLKSAQNLIKRSQFGLGGAPE